MLRHFLKIFLRTSFRSAGYTIINVSGLAIGLAASIFILLWVWDETHFDTHHLNRDRIFKIMSAHKFPDGTQVIDDTPGPLAAGLRELPEVEESCRLSYANSRMLLRHSDNAIYEEGVYADPTVFNVLTIPLIEGVNTAVLQDNNAIVISQKLADKYFPGEGAVGKTFVVNGERECKVTGVFTDVPANSSFRFDFIMPYRAYSATDKYNDEWGAWTGGVTFVLLHPQSDLASLTAKIGKTLTEPNIWVRWDTNVELFLHPLTDERLYSGFDNEGKQDGGRIAYVRIFTIVGIFILAIACVNFMNLATARSVSRSKEIGVRKVAGAGRRSLIGQFFSESILIAFVALACALILVQLLLPSFNSLTQKELSIDITNPVVVTTIVAIALFTGLLAGIYPALLLSSVKPVLALKGKFKGVGGRNIRKALVIFQFSLSTVLIVCASMAHMQIRYMKDKDLGFDRDNIVYFSATRNVDNSFDAFRNSALQHASIIEVAEGNSNPMQIFGGMVLSDNAWPGKTKEDNIVFTWMQCNHDYLPMLGFEIVAGRNFSKDNPIDSLNYIVSEEAVRQMKLKDPIGAKLKAPHEGTIIGVVKDFNSLRLQFGLQPIIIAMTPKRNPQIFVRYEPGKTQEALTHLQDVYKKIEPEVPMEYKFMDAPFGNLYANELLIEKLSMYFTSIAILISCLGLFGLASFTAESRTKEIGVRKVLGASASQVVALLCRDFVGLIGLSLIIGLPLGWWAVQNYLEQYAFHTDMNVWVFISIIAGMIGVTFISVSYQSAKAAITNPVKTLRSE